MMTHCTQATQQMKERWLSPLVGSLVVATVVMVTLQPVGQAAAECFVNDDTATVQDSPRWEGIISPIQRLPTIIIPTQSFLCGLTPYLNSSRTVLGKADNFGNTIFTACLRLKSGKMGRSDQITLNPIGKANSRMQPLKASATPYNSKKQVFNARLTPPEFTRITNYKPIATIIGPVQEFQNPPPSDEQSMPQTIPPVPPMVKPSTLFGEHSWGPFNQFRGLQQLPNGESHRMNMGTALSLHSNIGCMSDCP